MNTIQKRITSFTAAVLLSFFAMNCFGAEDIPINKTGNPLDIGRKKVPFRIPLAASFSSEAIFVSFSSAVGLATVTISDESGELVYQETIDTFTQPDFYIPIESSWHSGSYIIIIQYGSITLNGEFLLE